MERIAFGSGALGLANCTHPGRKEWAGREEVHDLREGFSFGLCAILHLMVAFSGVQSSWGTKDIVNRNSFRSQTPALGKWYARPSLQRVEWESGIY